MTSSIIKAVTQTQFENCVTAFAFITLDFKIQTEAGKVVSMGDEIISCSKAFFNDGMLKNGLILGTKSLCIQQTVERLKKFHLPLYPLLLFGPCPFRCLFRCSLP